MVDLLELKKGQRVKGLIPGDTAHIIDVTKHGEASMEVTYRDSQGHINSELLDASSSSKLEVIDSKSTYTFTGDGKLFRLVSEARRIRLAHLFDPLLAVHTSQIEPLPHQITAVYGEMLDRQPLRFLLADDPGAGKTIMAGLLIKELMVRGDLRRCLICCPGSLAEQWQDELGLKFGLPFDIVGRQTIEDSRSGNPYTEHYLVISRMDVMSRNDDVKAMLRQTEWDLIVVDEAHKMSATFTGGEVKETGRHKLGKLFGQITRHLLLMTATPHNGKDDDFHLFMRLLDPDRFEGQHHEDGSSPNVSDMMRRLVKEGLVRFDGTPLFPDRVSHTCTFTLSEGERELYEDVTAYVREEMNRADRLAAEGQRKRRNIVGFALTILQRRLASSPEAIYQSLKRRRERLTKRLAEAEAAARGETLDVGLFEDFDRYAEDEFEDPDDIPNAEIEDEEERVVDQATAARTVPELRAEIETLSALEAKAKELRNSNTDKKWEQLRGLLEEDSLIKGNQKLKLVVFSEHRDTLNYLAARLRNYIGRQEAVVTIDGSLRREQRREAQLNFTQDKDCQILVATDAAGEGINLQCAHLMINYDLPWNPNRIEQRFGRIHRIGQTEVCHLWNLVAGETREGAVYQRLLEKIETQKEALEGKVFNVLGDLFEGRPLKDLLLEAVRYGDDPTRTQEIYQVVEERLNPDYVRSLLAKNALTEQFMDEADVETVRKQMEEAEARRLQPHYIASFFREGFRFLKGSINKREEGRYEITYVPAEIREHAKAMWLRKPVVKKYQRVTFQKDKVTLEGNPLVAEFICPGHPLLDAVIDLILTRHGHLLREGAVLLNPKDTADPSPRLLTYIEHEIQDCRTDEQGHRRAISRRMQFVELDNDGHPHKSGYAPYLDYEPAPEGAVSTIKESIPEAWLTDDPTSEARSFAISTLAQEHKKTVSERREHLISKTRAEVQKRLTKEIMYWDKRAEELKQQELAGRQNARINSGKARQRANELEERLKKRLHELDQEHEIKSLAPIVTGCALVVPKALIEEEDEQWTADAAARKKIEEIAMKAVEDAEKELGRETKDIHEDNRGYDLISKDKNGNYYFIEVKGRRADAPTVTISRNEILYSFNKPEGFILAIVLVDGETPTGIHYIRHPFDQEPDYNIHSINYKIKDLLKKATPPQ